MSPEVAERALEDAIECGLLRHGPDACAGEPAAMRETVGTYGEAPPGGYLRRRPEDYDRALCLLPRDVVDFVLATQPREWQKLAQHHGAAVKEQFLRRLAGDIERRGALDVLRNGLKDSGCKFRLAYFRPASGLNEETRRLHAANLFAVARQLRYSGKNENCLDLVLFLNGIPIFTAELKNPLNGQDVEDAIRQYKTDRDAREPLLAYGRCLAHFAVDPDLVYVTTQLAGPNTRFLPFNRGKFGGAGNPPVPPTQKGYATAYLWEEMWARDSVLDLVRQFIHEVEEEDEKGRRNGKRSLIFPRYQQLDAVRGLVAHARGSGTGQRYLIQHSAGSGKSFTIAWLAHQLATLHDACAGGRCGDARGGAGERDPRRDGEARSAAERLDLCVHRHAQAQDAGALRHEAGGREIRVLPPLHHAPGDRGGLHPRRARELHDLHGLLASAQEGRERPALRQEES